MALGNRIYSLNESFFDLPISTEAAAYILGFAATDGHCNRSGLRFSLAERDRNHLQVLADALESSAPIVDYEQKSFGKTVRMSRIIFSSQKIVNSLFLLGLTGDKTDTVAPPNLDSNLMRHFFRGAFDGDGSVSKTIHSTTGMTCWELAFIGNLTMTQAFSKFVMDNLGCHNGNPRLAANTNRAWVVRWRGHKIPRKVAKLLYDDCIISLDRKRNALNELIEDKTFNRRGMLTNNISSDQLDSMRSLGYSWQTIANLTGVCLRTIHSHRRRLKTGENQRA